jgi:phage shock protein PspC (stress-responsive transcriptional regulator)
MSLADELTRLEQLRERGALSEAEFARAKSRLLDPQGNAPGSEPRAAINALRRSRSDRWIGGVCGGVAAMIGLEAWIVRLLMTLLFFVGGTGLLLYVLLWIFVPSE